MNIEVCVNSLLGLFKFVAIVDLDEFIVPRHRHRILDMIYDQTHKSPSRPPIFAFIFKMAFFCSKNDTSVFDLAAGEEERARKFDSVSILRDNMRGDVIHNSRYKYIVRPEALYEAEVHRPHLSPTIMWQYGNNATLFVHTDDAVIHHYRGIQGLTADAEKFHSCSITDNTLPSRFGKRILESSLYKAYLNEGFLDALGKVKFIICTFINILVE